MLFGCFGQIRCLIGDENSSGSCGGVVDSVWGNVRFLD